MGLRTLVLRLHDFEEWFALCRTVAWRSISSQK